MLMLPVITRASRLFLLLAFLVPVGSVMALAQTTGSVPASSPTSAQTTPSTPLSQADLWVKVIGGIVVGVAGLFGLPTGILLYKKTRAEITKLELESAALRAKPESSVENRGVAGGSYNVLIEGRDNTVQITADPRFLAPLLVLLDFIFAWVVLTIANHLLSLVTFVPFSDLLTGVLAFVLLVPIARQVQRVRTLLNPPRTLEEVTASVRQTRIAGYAGYIFVLIVTLLVGILLLTLHNLTQYGHYLARGLIGFATLLAAFGYLFKVRFDRFLIRMQQADMKTMPET